MDARLSIKLYGATEIQKLLNINRNKLFFWTQTKRLVVPMKEVRGSGKGNKFSFKNLLDLALIKKLDDSGYELNAIQIIIWPGDYMLSHPELFEKKGSLHGTIKKIRIESLWDFIKKHKDFYKKHGCVLFITREASVVEERGLTLKSYAKKKGREIIIEEKFLDFVREIITKEELLQIIGKGQPILEYEDLYLIDLITMIQKLEYKTEEKWI